MDFHFGLGSITAMNHSSARGPRNGRKSWASVAATGSHTQKSPTSPSESNRGFVRLDSLEGPCPSYQKSASPLRGTPPPPPPAPHHSEMQTEADTKWFGRRRGDPVSSSARSFDRPRIDRHQHEKRFQSFRHHNHHPQPVKSHWQPPANFQMPLNLNTGRVELWHTVGYHHQPYQSDYHQVASQPEMYTPMAAAAAAAAVSSVALTPSSSYFSLPDVCNLFGTMLGTINSVMSNLNPNARAFTPSSTAANSLNPNAKEFVPPSQSSPSLSKPKDISRPSIGDEIKSAKSDLVEAPSKASTQSQDCQGGTSWSSQGTASTIENEAASSVDSELYSRARSFSSCSSDDGGIEFSMSPVDNPHAASANNAKSCHKSEPQQPRKCLFKVFLHDDEDESEEESEDESDEESDDDEDDDWDEVDSGMIVVDLPEEFKDCGGLICPIESRKAHQPATTKIAIDEAEEERDSIKSLVEDQFPGLKSDADETRRRLRDANDSWTRAYCDNNARRRNSDDALTVPAAPSMRKSVSFSHPECWRSISEDPEMSEALNASRRSDLAQRKADLARMERTLAPVLDPAHRQRVYQRLYGCGSQNSESGSDDFVPCEKPFLCERA